MIQKQTKFIKMPKSKIVSPTKSTQTDENSWNSNPNPLILTREEVCDLLRISLPTLHKYTQQGTIQGYRVGANVRYKYSEVMKSLVAISSN